MTGSSVDTASAPRVATAAISSAPSQVRMRRHARRGSLAHASISGSTTKPPAMSPSHHVRQNVGASDPEMTPPASIDTVPTVALIAVAIAERHEHPADLLDAIERRARADEPPQQQGAHDDLGHVAGLLAEQAPERQRVLGRRAALR